jgi:hypothetical protein
MNGEAMGVASRQTRIDSGNRTADRIADRRQRADSGRESGRSCARKRCGKTRRGSREEREQREQTTPERRRKGVGV